MNSGWTAVKPNVSNPEEHGIYITIPVGSTNPIAKEILTGKISDNQKALKYLDSGAIAFVYNNRSLANGFYWLKIGSFIPPMKALFKEFMYIRCDIPAHDINGSAQVDVKWSELKNMKENGWIRTENSRDVERDYELDDPM